MQSTDSVTTTSIDAAPAGLNDKSARLFLRFFEYRKKDKQSDIARYRRAIELAEADIENAPRFSEEYARTVQSISEIPGVEVTFVGYYWPAVEIVCEQTMLARIAGRGRPCGILDGSSVQKEAVEIIPPGRKRKVVAVKCTIRGKDKPWISITYHIYKLPATAKCKIVTERIPASIRRTVQCSL